jgi:hypothetical protein
VAFLLMPFPALFLAGPLAGLLLLTRPRTFRERTWLGAALLGAAATLLLGPSSAAHDLLRASGLVFTGALVVLSARTTGTGLGNVTRALGLTVIAIGGGALALGVEWPSVRGSLERELQDGVDFVFSGSGLSAAQVAFLDLVVAQTARLYPGIVALGALAGGTLAGALTRQVAVRPVPGKSTRFTEFRFNDHVVWGAAATLAMALAPLSGPWADLVANLVLVWAGLYGTRGAAVAVTLTRALPTPLRLALSLSALVLLPYALGGLALLGLADTWLDLRRLTAGPPGQGEHS